MYRMSNWRFALAAALTLIIGLATFSAAQAEGSLELNPSGDRTYFLSEPVSQIGIPNRTLINVYVNAGEYVLLGSSNYASLTATQDIGWTSPTGTDNGLCDVINGGTGHIGSRTLEAAGPRGTGNPSGWDPGDLANPSSSATDCVFEAAETGIYQVEFYSPNLAPTAAVTSDVSINSTPVDDPFPGNAGAAWDVTVRTDAEDETTTIEGRAYANWLSVTMGNWPATNQAILYILTVEGYLYRINMNNLDPFVFVFFSNSKGPRDINTGEALFRSVTGVGQGVDWNLHLPQNADNPATNDYTHKIFFNPPASDLPVNTDVPFAGGGTTWLVNDPVTPPVPTAFSFAGAEDDTPGQGAVGVGGTFTVTLDNPPVGGSLQVQLDINDDGDWDDPEDKTLFGDFTPGQNTVTVDWDGTDGTGAFVGAGTLSASTFRSRTNIAEVHFPFWDAESSPDGLIIERMTDPTATTVADATIYYDDSDPSLDPVGDQLAPNPRAALGGLDSTNGAHTWGTSTIDYSFAWGDGKLIDTWANLPSGTFVELDSDVTLVEADL
ncbi:MAG: hypothetical protein GYB64_09540, partial [Chloroflexi bacterium]|nr:hypothetical protein [Chloroflexota bacterium]